MRPTLPNRDGKGQGTACQTHVAAAAKSWLAVWARETPRPRPPNRFRRTNRSVDLAAMPFFLGTRIGPRPLQSPAKKARALNHTRAAAFDSGCESRSQTVRDLADLALIAMKASSPAVVPGRTPQHTARRIPKVRPQRWPGVSHPWRRRTTGCRSWSRLMLASRE